MKLGVWNNGIELFFSSIALGDCFLNNACYLIKNSKKKNFMLKLYNLLQFPLLKHHLSHSLSFFAQSVVNIFTKNFLLLLFFCCFRTIKSFMVFLLQLCSLSLNLLLLRGVHLEDQVQKGKTNKILWNLMLSLNIIVYY